MNRAQYQKQGDRYFGRGVAEFANRLDFINSVQYVLENKVPGMVLGGFGLEPRNPGTSMVTARSN